MNFLTGTVSLIQVDNLYLAVSIADTLMIGQSSEVAVLQDGGNGVGSYEYAGAKLPVYSLNDRLMSTEDSVLVKQSQFCIGLRTSNEANYFVLLCKKFEQIDLAEQTHNIQELPAFMCKERMLVEGMLEYQNLVYLVTSSDKIFDYIASDKSANQKQEIKNA